MLNIIRLFCFSCAKSLFGEAALCLFLAQNDKHAGRGWVSFYSCSKEVNTTSTVGVALLQNSDIRTVAC